MWIDGYWIVGMPFETKEDILRTFRFSDDLGLDWNTYSIYKIYPNTELYDECVQEGLIDEVDFREMKPVGSQDAEEEEDCRFKKDYEYSATVVNARGKDWTRPWLFDVHYEHNLKNNFINNRNLKCGNHDQALRDFNYVLGIAPHHAIAYRQGALAFAQKGDMGKALQYAERERLIMSKENEFTYWYKKLGIENLAIDAISPNSLLAVS